MKKRKISQKRVWRIRDWLISASVEELTRLANSMGPSLRSAAEAFGLDPHSEWHREILLRILAQLVFSDGKKGRPKETLKWYPEREYDLGYHFHLLRQEKPGIKFSEAAKAVKRRWPKEYADSSETTLRQRMRSAYSFWEEVHEESKKEDVAMAEFLGTAKL